MVASLLFASSLPGERIEMWGSLNTISFIGNRYANLRDTSGFETPPSKRVGGNFVQDAITGALRHRRLGNRAARNVDKHQADAASGNIGVLCFVWIFGQRRAHC